MEKVVKELMGGTQPHWQAEKAQHEVWQMKWKLLSFFI